MLKVDNIVQLWRSVIPNSFEEERLLHSSSFFKCGELVNAGDNHYEFTNDLNDILLPYCILGLKVTDGVTWNINILRLPFKLQRFLI